MISAALLALALALDVQDAVPVNGGFESWEGGLPVAWSVPPASLEAGWVVEQDRDEATQGEACLRFECEGDGDVTVPGLVYQDIDASELRGRRVKLAARLMVDNAVARMWMRVDLEGGGVGFFDDMRGRPLEEGDWSPATIVGDVAEDAGSVQIGFEVLGAPDPRAAEVWIDRVELVVLAEGESVGPVPAAPLDDVGRANLAAFARLLGAVRFFHPSDEVAAADWERVAAEGVLACESAATGAALADRLRELFGPVAPTLVVAAEGTGAEAPAGLERPTDAERLYERRWFHVGLHLSDEPSLYTSRRERRRVKDDEEPEWVGSEHARVSVELGRGVIALVPTAVWADREGTLPRAQAEPPPSRLPDDFEFLPYDRTTRLASVCLGWSALAHAYPYFDVVDVDWESELVRALDSAATDATVSDFAATLERMIAALQDGHGSVQPGSSRTTWIAPVALEWVDDELIVAREGAGGSLSPGDRVLSIGGRSTEAVYREVAAHISGAREGWVRHLAAFRMLRSTASDALTVEVEPIGEPGSRREVVLEPSTTWSPYEPARPDVHTELEPGIRYIDLTRCDDATFSAAVDELAGARAVVFDLRGYPGGLSPETFLSHLLEEPGTSPQWHVPRLHAPGITTFDRRPGWQLEPREPRLPEHRAMLIGAGCISYAESCLGIVEHYGLCDLYGSTTAGTNGNVNTIPLPSGHTIRYTGMRVLKHDGSQHHGVGIEPTHPVARTRAGLAEGRDEVLEAALAGLREALADEAGGDQVR